MSICGFQLAQLITSKVSDSYIRDLGFNLYLHKKTDWYLGMIIKADITSWNSKKKKKKRSQNVNKKNCMKYNIKIKMIFLWKKKKTY